MFASDHQRTLRSNLLIRNRCKMLFYVQEMYHYPCTQGNFNCPVLGNYVLFPYRGSHRSGGLWMKRFDCLKDNILYCFLCNEAIRDYSTKSQICRTCHIIMLNNPCSLIFIFQSICIQAYKEDIFGNLI